MFCTWVLLTLIDKAGQLYTVLFQGNFLLLAVWYNISSYRESEKDLVTYEIGKLLHKVKSRVDRGT